MKNLCVCGMKTAVYTTHSAVRHKVSGMNEAMKVQVDLFVHSFRLLQMLSSLLDDTENHTHIVADARIILKQLFKSHSLTRNQVHFLDAAGRQPSFALQLCRR
jgi:hypothetical protein